MTITPTGSNPVTVTASGSTTTTSSSRLQDINDSILGLVEPGATIDGFGLELTPFPAGATVTVTNDGLVTSSQDNGLWALQLQPAGPGPNFGTFTYSGTGNVTNTGNGGGLLVDSAGTGNVDITVSGTSTISGAPGVFGPPSSGASGIETSTGTGTVTVTVQTGGTVEGQSAVAFGGGVNTLDNSGTVQGLGYLSGGVNGQVATVTNSAMISGEVEGVGVDDVTLTNNSGATIETTGTTSDDANNAAIEAVEALTAANITNKSGATIQTTGTLGIEIAIAIGQGDPITGAPVATGDATVDNAGTISGNFDAINTNTTGTTSITNSASGSITATVRSGIRVNTATVENDKGATISGLNGIFFRNDPTAGQTFAASSVFNDGTITGTGSTVAPSIAIHFSTGSVGNTLTLGTDSVINGNVLGAGSDILQLGGTGSASFNVSNIGAAAQYEGFSTFNKIGSSTWTLTGTDTDGWTVEQGTLQVDGTIGNATVDSGAVLDGTGTTGAVTVASGGTLTPGDAPGTIATGNLDMQAGSTLAIQLGGTSPGSFGEVAVTGSVTLTGSTLSTSLFNGFTPGPGESFELINNDGSDPVVGTFAGLSEGAAVVLGGTTFHISYVGGTGNDVVLSNFNPNAPTIALGTTVAAWTEEQALPTSLAPAVAASDPHSATLASATVQITGGTFTGDGDTLSGTGNGTIVVSYNSSTETLTLTGSDTIADYQTVLDSVTFNAGENPTDFGSAPTRTLTWVLNDGTLSSDPAISTINITNVNDPPSLANVAPSAAFTEHGSAVTLSAAVSVSDLDDLDLVGATVQITGGTFSGNSDVLSATGNGTIVASYNSNTETLTLTGTDTLAHYAAVLDTVTFTSGENPTDFGSNPTRTVVWTLNDGSASNNLSSAVTSTINVTNINDAPTVNGVPASASFTEEGGAVTLASAVSIADVDDVNLTGATVKIIGGTFASDGDVLSATGTASIAVSYNSATETLTLSGTDTLAHYQSVLDTVTFNAGENPSNFGSNPSRTLAWTVTDPGGTANGGVNVSTPVTSTVNITNVNDAPSLANVAPTAFFTEHGGAVTLSGAVSVSDLDELNLVGATVQITGGTFTGNSDTLAIGGATSGTVGAIAFSYNSSSEMLTLSGTDTLAHYQSVLDTVTFNSGENPTDFGSNPTRTVVWTLNDGSASNSLSAGVSSTINITNINDAPTLSNVPPGTNFTEESGAVTLASAVSIADVDDVNLSGATVKIVGGTFANDGDVLSATGTASIAVSYNSTTETLTLSGTDTLAHYQSVLDSVTFTAGENPTNFGSNPSRTLTWTVTDPSGTANGGVNVSTPVTSTVNITNVNDPPSLANVAAFVAFQPQHTITISPALSVSDPDNLTLSNATVRITGGTFTGDGDQLAIGGAGSGTVGAISFSYNSSTETLTLTGSDTLAHYSQVLDSVTFDSTSANPTNSGSAPSRTLTWVVNDGAASNNLSTAATTTIGIGITPRNDFNADGKSDLLWQNNDGEPAIWEMNGATIIGGGLVTNPGSSWHIEASGDFNHDGKADIVVQNSDGLPEIWLMNGASVTSTVTLPNPGTAWHVIATGDFNGDGNTDILWQNNDGAADIWEMNGPSTFVGGGILSLNPGPSWHLIGAGDVNGDGKADLLWQNNDGAAAIWEMNGTSIIGGGSLVNPGASWHAIGLGDFNGDGKADILWQNNDGAAAIWEMNGTSIIGGGILSPNPGSSWHAIGTSDFNGDGLADIVWQNNDGTPAIWEMNGTSIIGGGVLVNPGASWHVKDDGPISPNPTGAGLQPPALQLSTPDAANPVPMRSAPDGAGTWPTGFAGPGFVPPAQSAPPSAATGFISSDHGQPMWPQLHTGAT